MKSVSVVVISKNERGLADTINAIRPQAAAIGAEIMVVDASDGQLSDIERDNPDIVWVPFRSVTGKAITIPEQRNVGVRSATGEVIVFTDCGCLPEQGWLAELTAPIQRGDAVVVTGAFGSVRAGMYDRVDSGKPTEPTLVEECPTANLAFTREAFDAVGGVDERFDYGSDVDFSWRLRDRGVPILRVPSAVILMDWGDRRRQIRRSFVWGAGRARLYLKHRNRILSLPRRDPVALAYSLFLIGLPLLAFAYLAPWVLLYLALLAVPIWRNRRERPLRTLASHFLYSAGFMWQVGRAAWG